MSNEVNGQVNDEAVRSNKEGGELFKAGQFEAAAARYQSAILADTSKSPLYFSNLAAAYLKLRKFAQAESAAHTSLVRDPKSTKARYRRSMARKEVGHLAEALVDLVSLLTTSPGNAEAAAAFEEISKLYRTTDAPRISLESIVAADFPHAFGSPTALQNRTSDRKPSSSDYHMPAIQSADRVAPALISGRCTTCHITKARRDMKTCRKCKCAMYCSTTCQRANWPDHKPTCSLPEDNNLTFRLGRQIGDHTYFRTHLTAYGVRALGLTHVTVEQAVPPTRLLLLLVDMVPIVSDAARKRLRLKHILPVPLTVLPPEIVRSHTEMLKGMQMLQPNAVLIGVCIGTTGVYGDGEDTRYRVLAFPVPPVFLRQDFSMALRSNSFGEDRKIAMDLDLLYANIEDELSFDADNHYGMQG